MWSLVDSAYASSHVNAIRKTAVFEPPHFMDILGTIVSVIDLSDRLLKYVGDVKGGRAQRDTLRDKLIILDLLLPMLQTRLKSASQDVGSSISAGTLAFQRLLEKCRDTLEEIRLILEKAERKERELLWPFVKADILEKTQQIEQLVSWVKIAVEFGISAMMERIQDDLASVKASVGTITSQLRDITGENQLIGNTLKAINSSINEDTLKSLRETKSKLLFLDEKKLQSIIIEELCQHSLSSVVLDAFDEILEEAVRENLLQLFEQWTSKCHTHVMVTSRPHVRTIKADATLEIITNAVDIQKFIEDQLSHMKSISNLERNPPEVKKLIIAAVHRKSSQIFLLAKLHMLTAEKKVKQG
ncbi:hypothetical protein M422DRAFT_248784 [Sphaerobolus stellatus SS14]|nr:hypothetical protein M422DRAFT_248784 [Sphaerobolus stellatus SS14]